MKNILNKENVDFNQLKRIILLSIFCISLFNNAMAQQSFVNEDKILRKGTSGITVGYGAVTPYFAYPRLLLGGITEKGANITNTRNLGTVFLRYEYFVTNGFSLGLSISSVTSSARWNNYNPPAGTTLEVIFGREGEYNIRALGTLLNANFYWLQTPRTYLYSRLGLGYNWANLKLKNDVVLQNNQKVDLSENLSSLSIGVSVLGVKHMFTKKLGVYAEIGYEKSLINAGVHFGLN